jgi:hypothetical protein
MYKSPNFYNTNLNISQQIIPTAIPLKNKQNNQLLPKYLKYLTY